MPDDEENRIHMVQICVVPPSDYGHLGLFGVGADGVVYEYNGDDRVWVPLSMQKRS